MWKCGPITAARLRASRLLWRENLQRKQPQMGAKLFFSFLLISAFERNKLSSAPPPTHTPSKRATRTVIWWKYNGRTHTYDQCQLAQEHKHECWFLHFLKDLEGNSQQNQSQVSRQTLWFLQLPWNERSSVNDGHRSIADIYLIWFWLDETDGTFLGKTKTVNFCIIHFCPSQEWQVKFRQVENCV